MAIGEDMLAQILDKIIEKIIELEIRIKTGPPYHPDAELVKMRELLKQYFGVYEDV